MQECERAEISPRCAPATPPPNEMGG